MSLARVASPRLVALVAVLGFTACTYPATQVHVAMDTDAPNDRALTIRATVRSDDGARIRIDTHEWVRGGARSEITLPASFAVTPGELPRDAHVELTIEASLDATGVQPRLAFRRIARFGFTPRRTTTVPIFLSIACGNESRDCTRAGVACTVSQRCEEQGLTCGDRGECVPRDVTPTPIDPDAGPQFPDVVPTDAVSDASVDVIDVMDSGLDVPLDAPPVDVPAEMGSDGPFDPDPPRLVAPLSTSIVGSPMPRLRWLFAPRTDGVRVELCTDRPCASVAYSIDYRANEGTVTAALTPGVWFWRAMALVGPLVGSRTTPTWQFTVRAAGDTPTLSHGTVLDVNGDGLADIAVGASAADSGAGRVDVFLGTRGTMPGPRSFAIPGPMANTDFGWRVASAGDVNGDGYGDLAVTAAVFSGAPGTGAAYIYLGGPTGIATTPSATLRPYDASAFYFGCGFAPAGDVNGDGYADVLVGDCGQFSVPGRAYLYFGNASGTPTGAATALLGRDGNGDYFSHALESVGDYDDDGFGDVLVTAYAAASNSGAAYLFRGSASGLVSTPAITFPPPGPAGQLFGSAVACDDFDVDGHLDLLIGASGMAATDGGHVYLYRGTASGWPTTPTSILGNPRAQPGDYFGDAISAVDIEGDGDADAVIGSPHRDGQAGEAQVYHGGPFSLTGPSTVLFAVDGAPGRFGAAISGCGDINGDGFGDVVVGAPGAMTNAGAAYAWIGRSVGIPTAPTARLGGGGAANEMYGTSVGE